VYQVVTHHRWFTSKEWWDGKLKVWEIDGRAKFLSD
jgi:hypothetical protein